MYGADTEYEAKIIGSDEKTALAVIKIEKKKLTHQIDELALCSPARA